MISGRKTRNFDMKSIRNLLALVAVLFALVCTSGCTSFMHIKETRPGGYSYSDTSIHLGQPGAAGAYNNRRGFISVESHIRSTGAWGEGMYGGGYPMGPGLSSRGAELRQYNQVQSDLGFGNSGGGQYHYGR